MSPDGSGRGDANKFITRLFPDMRFGCNGTIVRMVVAVVDRGGREVPKIQIWRESKTQAGIYHRQDSDIRVVNDGSMCIRHRLGGGIFRCTLSESFQVSVQHGDILGLELPPKSDDDFDIYFNTGGSVPQNYVFEGQLNSTVNISEAAHQSYDLPQINLVVVLGSQTACIPCIEQ